MIGRPVNTVLRTGTFTVVQKGFRLGLDFAEL